MRSFCLARSRQVPAALHREACQKVGRVRVALAVLWPGACSVRRQHRCTLRPQPRLAAAPDSETTRVRQSKSAGDLRDKDFIAQQDARARARAQWLCLRGCSPHHRELSSSIETDHTPVKVSINCEP
eukprot:1217328-Rhodomonas_salina.2